MFDPSNRVLLSDMLRPPSGFVLEQAVGTTFTLDLATALGVPLAFASAELSHADDVGLLAALSQSADRITIFTQAGRISPGIRSDLLTLLEDVVHPVHPPQGIFHPKVWFAAYASADSADEDRRFRFLCLSRNLTEDRTWDMSVRLDGVTAPEHEQDQCAEQNQPLVGLLRSLPQMCVAALPPARAAALTELASSIRAVRWERPPGCDALRFHHLHGGAHAVPTQPAKDVLIVSPFVTADGLSLLRQDATGETRLISRQQSVDALPESALDSRLRCHSLDSALFDAQPGPGDDLLAGLHAKAVFRRHRRAYSRATALIGSANATESAWRRNVEVMVEVEGHASVLGPEAVLEQMRPLLEDLERQDAEPDPEEEARRSLESSLTALATSQIHLRLASGHPWSLAVWADEDADTALARMSETGQVLTWSLCGRPETRSRGLGCGEEAATVLTELALADVTPFIELTLTDSTADGGTAARTVVLAELHDDEERRRPAALTRCVGDGDAFLRLLLLLLNPQRDMSLHAGASGAAGDRWSAMLQTRGIFETLMHSLARGDSGITTAHRILQELLEAREGEVELPDGFLELWQNIWQVRSGSAGTRSSRAENPE